MYPLMNQNPWFIEPFDPLLFIWIGNLQMVGYLLITIHDAMPTFFEWPNW
jgi:hypothetical protein